MASPERPLLADDDNDSTVRREQEEESLLTGEKKQMPKKYGWGFWRELGVFTWAFVATVAVVILAVQYQHNTGKRPEPSNGTDLDLVKQEGKRNLIFMVSDGMGPASLSLTRSFRQYTSGLPIDDVLVLDKHLIGQSRTRSSSSLVTDSAAGATAFSCGKKSYNGAISILPDQTLCGTVLEAAKRAGYMTGLVVTTRITDATPATFGAHAARRSYEDSIARQLIGEHPLGHNVDLMLGGGRCHFLPRSVDGSCREDEYDVVKSAQDKGYTYLSTREEFDKLHEDVDVKLPMLGLFAPTDIPYEVDRRNMSDVYPSLDEMAITALNALKAATRDSDKGFFIMIEGSRIDHAGHGNDPVAQVHEVLAYDKAFSSVLNFLENDDTNGVLVGTSDHETGGLALARQLNESYPVYRWYPDALAKATHSGEYLSKELFDYATDGIKSKEDMEQFVRRQLSDGLGINDASDAEVTKLVESKSFMLQTAYTFADIISRRAQTGWSTHGHSAVDVNIYSSDPQLATSLLGNHENTEVGDFLADFLDVDVAAITKDLNDKTSSFHFDSFPGNTSWLGEISSDEHLDSIDHYSGDFRKRQIVGCGCGMH